MTPLSKIFYRGFEWEFLEDWAVNLPWHHLDGEIKFVFDDDSVKYISWGNGPVQYCIEIGSKSFFTPEVVRDIDLTHHPMWAELLGQNLRYKYMDEECQILKITGGDGQIFLSSQYKNGSFCGDCVRVAKTQPVL